MNRPRLGFLGVGWIGKNRMQAVQESGVAEVCAIADATPSMLDAAAEVVPGAVRCGSLDELLAQSLDGVVIATPSAMHAEQSIQSLKRGVAVFCQKPLGRSAAETRAVVKAARAADRLLGVDFSYRYTNATMKMREVIARGDTGRVFGCRFVFHNAYGPDKPWFYDRAHSGGGCAMDLGIHLIDLALWLFDFPKVTHVTSRLYAGGEPLPENPSAVEDYAIARLDCANGMTVELACSWRLSAGCDAVIEGDVYGTSGGVAFRNVNGSFFDLQALQFRGTSRTVLSEPPDAWGGRAVVDWASRLAAGERYSASADDLVRVAEVLDRIYLSNR